MATTDGIFEGVDVPLREVSSGATEGHEYQTMRQAGKESATCGGSRPILILLDATPHESL